MPYTPNNVNVYTAAFTGCVGGMIANRRITNSQTVAYADVARVADAWAQAVDGLWVGTPTLLDIDNIAELSEAEFVLRFPNPKVEPASVIPATYSPVALAVMAVMQAAQNRYAAEGITPPPLPGGTGQAVLPLESADLLRTAVDEVSVGGGEFALTLGGNGATASYKDVIAQAKSLFTWFFDDLNALFNIWELGPTAGAVTIDTGRNFAIRPTAAAPTMAGTFGNGAGVFYFAQAGTIPNANPTAGELIYVDSGDVVRVRKPNGNINVLGDADAVTPAALDIDWNLGNLFEKALGNGDNLITFSNTYDKTIVVRLTGTGTSVVAWPGTIKWSGGVAPTQTAGGTDVYTFVQIGGTIYGQVVPNFS